jgi:hypothetical protein
MIKKYSLIGGLVIVVALAISAFAWVSIKGSTALVVGQGKSLVALDKGERDSISPSLQLAESQVGPSQASLTLDKGERDSIPPALQLDQSQAGQSQGSVTLDKGERDLIP